jgi:hypothetical protein
VPLAAAVNVAVAPTATDTLVGCVVIASGVFPEATVRVAALVVALPAEFVNTASYFVPDCATVVAGVVYDAEVAPEIAVNDDAPGAWDSH